MSSENIAPQPQVDIPALWQGIIDDAAVFPPGNAPMPEAVSRHADSLDAWYAPCVGPLLMPVGAVGAFKEAVSDAGVRIPAVGLAVRPGTATVDEIVAAVASLESVEGTRVANVETALPAGEPQGMAAQNLAATLCDALPESCAIWLEVRSAEDTHDAMTAIGSSQRPVGAKYRMGGTDAAGFPSIDDAFTVLEAAAVTGTRLKLTAGLHHLHRYNDTDLGVTHHGFGNVMACLHALLRGQEAPLARELLADPVHSHTTAILSEMSDSAVTALRTVLASFGCCGVTDPIDDLVAAGLLLTPAS